MWISWFTGVKYTSVVDIWTPEQHKVCSWSWTLRRLLHHLCSLIVRGRIFSSPYFLGTLEKAQLPQQGGGLLSYNPYFGPIPHPLSFSCPIKVQVSWLLRSANTPRGRRNNCASLAFSFSISCFAFDRENCLKEKSGHLTFQYKSVSICTVEDSEKDSVKLRICSRH